MGYYKDEFAGKAGYESNRHAQLALSEYHGRIMLDGTALTEKTVAFVRGETTTLVGREGAGKTTLVRTLAKNFMDNGYKCGFILTEETRADYSLGLIKAYDWDRANQEIQVYSIFEQANMSGLSHAESDKVWYSMPSIIDAYIKAKDLDVLFIDNMTTNKAVLDYDLGSQTRLFLEIKALAVSNMCSIVPIYHTSKSVRENIFENADIEGANAPAKLSHNILLHYNFKQERKAIVKSNKIRFDAYRETFPYHLLGYTNGLYAYEKSMTYEDFDGEFRGQRNVRKV